MGELWSGIPGFEGSYEVSNQGRVRRISRGPHTRPGFILKPRLRRGYPSVCLSAGSNGSQKAFVIHRLVIEAFIGPIQKGMHANHKNGNKTDSRLENLEVVTPSENARHALSVLGVKQNPLPPVRQGEKHHKAKLKDADIAEIFRLRSGGLSQQKIAAQIGIHQTGISNILRGKGWKHIA